MKEISFLVGSGFSMPCKIPGVGQINEVLNNPDSISSSVLSKDNLKALESIYNEYKDANKKNYENINNYEVFYDFIVLKKWRSVGEPIVPYFRDQYHFDMFKKSNSMVDCLNDMEICSDRYPYYNEIEIKFLDLISEILSKGNAFQYHHFPCSKKCCLEIVLYNKFLILMHYLKNSSVVNLHTLNHDMLLDFLLKSDPLVSSSIDDGFEVDKSPFYYEGEYNFCGKNEKNIKIPHYKGTYEKQFRLFKLHGCLGQFIVREKDSTENRLRLLPEMAMEGERIKNNESSDRIGKLVNRPFLLTGKYLKPNYQETDGSIQKELFDFFVKNLSNSHAIIIIGYGFGDLHVNEYLKPFFGKKEILKIVIDYSCDPRKPNVPFFSKIRENLQIDINDDGGNLLNIYFDFNGADNFSVENVISLLSK